LRALIPVCTHILKSEIRQIGPTFFRGNKAFVALWLILFLPQAKSSLVFAALHRLLRAYPLFGELEFKHPHPVLLKQYLFIHNNSIIHNI